MLNLVQYPDEMEVVRVIRNECKDYMTRDNSYITEEKQATFFDYYSKKLALGEMQVYLFAKYTGQGQSLLKNMNLGYGTIRQADGVAWIAGGLLAEHRGKGLGRELFELLLEKARQGKKPILLEVLGSNYKAYNLYKKLGFKTAYEYPKGEDYVVTMCLV